MTDLPQPTRIILQSALPPPHGGVASWTENLLRRGLPEPFEVTLVDTRVSRPHWDFAFSLSKGELSRNARIICQTRRLLASGRYHLLHINASMWSQGVYRSLLCAWMSRRARVPYIVHLRGQYDLPSGRTMRQRMWLKAYRRLFSGAAGIITLNESSHRNVLSLGNYQSRVWNMPNFIDCEKAPQRDPRSTIPGHLRVVFVGAVVREKGVQTILEAARRLDGVQFVLIGDTPGQYARSVESEVAQCALAARVRLQGPLPNDAVRAALADSDVFILPSWSEGFPISLIEAMAAGLPVVASSVGAIPQVVDQGRGGYVVGASDVTGFIEALRILRDNPAKIEEMGRYNRAKAMSSYDYGAGVLMLTDIYRKILARPA